MSSTAHTKGFSVDLIQTFQVPSLVLSKDDTLQESPFPVPSLVLAKDNTLWEALYQAPSTRTTIGYKYYPPFRSIANHICLKGVVH